MIGITSGFMNLLRKVRRFFFILFSHKPYRERLYDLYLLLGIRFACARMRGNRMWLDLSDPVLSRHFFIHRDYEPFEVFLMQRVVGEGMTGVDVGACIGYHTILISRCVGNSGAVIAFEPAPGNYSLLERNVHANHCANVMTFNAAVMDYRGSIDLYLSRANHGDHRVYNAQDEDRFEEGSPRERIPVSALRVDDVLDELGLKPDVIKIDVQGAEIAAFRGMKKAMAQPEVVVFCEFWPYGLQKFGTSPREMLDYLNSSGLHIYEICEEGGHIRRADFEDLTSRFPDLGCVNLVCFSPKGPAGKLLSPYMA